MTESSTPVPTLKIRIRLDTEPEIDAGPATLDMRRVLVALGILVLLLAAAFGMRAVMKNKLPEPELAPPAEVVAPPAPVAAALPLAVLEATRLDQASSSNQINRVTRAVLADIVRKHRPVQVVAGDLPASDVTKRFYFFTDVQDVATRRFTHRWEYHGKVVAQIRFSPSGKHWTGSSSKQIPTHMQGAWRAVLVDEHGSELSSIAFVYGKELTAAQN